MTSAAQRAELQAQIWKIANDENLFNKGIVISVQKVDSILKGIDAIIAEIES